MKRVSPKRWRRAAVVALAAVLMAGLAGAHPRAARAQADAIRSVDWVAVLGAQPGITLDAECPAAFDFLRRLGPCIEVVIDPAQTVVGNGPDPSGGFGGVALLTSESGGPLYGDIDGDGIEEAVIQTQSGGTGGSFGFLVFAWVDNSPRLVAAVPGYKTFVAIEDGLLIVQIPYYFGYEGNCCPTGFTKTWYTIREGRLVSAGRSYFANTDTGEGQAVGLGELIVHGFYRSLAARNFEQAWRFLSSRARQGRSFEEWRAGYAATRRIAVTTAPGAGDDEVLVEIEAEDEAPGGALIRHFTGSWFLVPDSTLPWGLALDRAVIRER